MLRPFRFQSSYILAFRPLGRHMGTITACRRGLSMTVRKHEDGVVLPKIPEARQVPNEHEPSIEARLEARPQPGSNKELQRLDDWWLKHTREREQEQEQELQKKNAEIQNLAVGPPFMISIPFLIPL